MAKTERLNPRVAAALQRLYSEAPAERNDRLARLRFAQLLAWRNGRPLAFLARMAKEVRRNCWVDPLEEQE